MNLPKDLRKFSILKNLCNDPSTLPYTIIRIPLIHNFKRMLYTIAIILVILWLLGLVTKFTIGGFIHILLIIAIIMVLIRVIRGEKIIQ